MPNENQENELQDPVPISGIFGPVSATGQGGGRQMTDAYTITPVLTIPNATNLPDNIKALLNTDIQSNVLAVKLPIPEDDNGDSDLEGAAIVVRPKSENASPLLEQWRVILPALDSSIGLIVSEADPTFCIQVDLSSNPTDDPTIDTLLRLTAVSDDPPLNAMWGFFPQSVTFTNGKPIGGTFYLHPQHSLRHAVVGDVDADNPVPPVVEFNPLSYFSAWQFTKAPISG